MKYPWGVFLGIVVSLGAGNLEAQTARALIQGTGEGSGLSGTATFTDTPEGLQISVQVAGVPAAQHGLHIHEFGDCGNQGNAAGGHYNPDGVPHGFLPTDGFAGAHAGDLGNIDVQPDGTGTLELFLAGLKLSDGKYTVGGRALVLHEKPDDLGQPTGNAGGRIGCGAIIITGK